MGVVAGVADAVAVVVGLAVVVDGGAVVDLIGDAVAVDADIEFGGGHGGGAGRIGYPHPQGVGKVGG